MSLDPSWRPNESGVELFNERGWLDGMVVCGVAYGIVLMLFIITFSQLVRTTTKSNLSMRLPFLIYITVITILGTLYLASLANFTQLAFVDYRMIPGGPDAFEAEEFSEPVDIVASVTYILANWMADGMLLYRFTIIFKDFRRLPLWLVMLVPCLAYLTSISLSIVWVVQVSIPSSSPWKSNIGLNITAPYFWMSISFNVAMTLAIVMRLLYHRWTISRILGPSHGTQYTSVVTIIVESALLYSTFALLFLIPYVVGNGIQNVFFELIGEVQIIASLLITYRLACGYGWDKNTSAFFTTRDDCVWAEVNPTGHHRDSRALKALPESDSTLRRSADPDFEIGSV